jgi:hypothetical protein
VDTLSHVWRYAKLIERKDALSPTEREELHGIIELPEEIPKAESAEVGEGESITNETTTNKTI